MSGAIYILGMYGKGSYKRRYMTVVFIRAIFYVLQAWQSLGIGIEGYALTFMGVNFCEECKRSSPSEIHGARYLFPFSPQMPRMEVS